MQTRRILLQLLEYLNEILKIKLQTSPINAAELAVIQKPLSFFKCKKKYN